MRYLLDTNIISNLAKPAPSENLKAWLGEQADGDLLIASVTLGELRQGVLEMPRGKRRDELEAWFTGRHGPQTVFAGRILSFDEHAAVAWARLMADGKTGGRPRSHIDMMIAAIAEVNDCTVVTDNERHFEGLPFINPLRAKP